MSLTEIKAGWGEDTWPDFESKMLTWAAGGTVWQLGTWNLGPLDSILGPFTLIFPSVQNKSFSDKSVDISPQESPRRGLLYQVIRLFKRRVYGLFVFPLKALVSGFQREYMFPDVYIVSGKLHLMSHFSDITPYWFNKDNLGHKKSVKENHICFLCSQLQCPYFSRAKVNVETPNYQQSWQWVTDFLLRISQLSDSLFYNKYF